MAHTLPIVAASLRFAYSEPEDRLTLLAADAQGHGVLVAITRRLTERFINGLSHLLERSSALAVHSPAELRDDIILMEHQDALYGQGQSQAMTRGEVQADQISNLPMPRLVTAIEITITPTTFELRLRDAKSPLIALSLNRRQVHRILEPLSHHAEAAGWNIILDAAWLEPGQTEIVLN